MQLEQTALELVDTKGRGAELPRPGRLVASPGHEQSASDEGPHDEPKGVFLLAPVRLPRLAADLAGNEISEYGRKGECRSFLPQLAVSAPAALLFPAILLQSLGGRHPGLPRRTDLKKADRGLVQPGRWRSRKALRQLHDQLDSLWSGRKVRCSSQPNEGLNGS